MVRFVTIIVFFVIASLVIYTVKRALDKKTVLPPPPVQSPDMALENGVPSSLQMEMMKREMNNDESNPVVDNTRNIIVDENTESTASVIKRLGIRDISRN